MIQDEVKNLWKLCFNDSEEYVDLYFQARYNNDVNIAIQSDEKVIAALQMLPYPMTYEGKEINTAYISGACTHPDYRNKGVMRELLSQAFVRMSNQDIHLSTLIPAEPWLFDYYAQIGYVPIFKSSKLISKAFPAIPFKNMPMLKVVQEYRDEDYEFLNRKMRERPNCIQHTKEGYQFMLSDLQTSKGKVYTLTIHEKTVALTVAYPTENGSLLLDDILYNNPADGLFLIQLICQENQLSSIEIQFPRVEAQRSQLFPFGMARIINAQAMLQLYAANHPDLKANLHITDKQICQNNGYYYLNDGKCMYSAKRLPCRHSTLTISQLTKKVFARLEPCMSLMLNH